MTAWTSRPIDTIRCGWLCLSALFLVAFLATGSRSLVAQDHAAGGRVTVTPVFVVPSDQADPTNTESQNFMRHMNIAQARDKQLLGSGVTFELATQTPVIYKSTNKLAHYRRKDRVAAQFVPELLQYFKVNRQTCSTIFVVVLMNPHDDFPAGGGKPINGGFNTGGGALALSSWGLNNKPNFQSTLQHELGHTFGLPHVSAYKYDMKTNPSIMSYNLAHHSNGFLPSATPGVLIPEDKRGLAKNQRVFPGLKFNRKTDVPAGYSMAAFVKFPPMDLDFTTQKEHEPDN